MALLDLTPHLTRDDTELSRLNATHKGMASWGGATPGKTCRECKFWAWQAEQHKRGLQLKPARCLEFQRLARGKAGQKVPHHAPACRYFDASEKPPEVIAK